MFNVENPMFYTAFEMEKTAMAMPIVITSTVMQRLLRAERFPTSKMRAAKTLAASYELFERMNKYYTKPAWEIDYIRTPKGVAEVKQEVVMRKAFCNLLHFKKLEFESKEKLLIVAPLSGHYATLLRGTVEGLLPHFDVYITEWINARDVPVFDGSFSLSDYVSYIIEFVKFFKGNVTVMAVCQPVVGAAVATTYMSMKKDPDLPKNLILVAGPIDARESPTEVNDFAVNRSLLWFSANMITRVPFMYAGATRRVYPGFLQLGGFMSMNFNKHTASHIELFKSLIRGDGDGVEKHRKFYDEYLAVMDLPAEFYLQTIDEVFHKFSLPRGLLRYCDETIDLKELRGVRLLAIEGEQDDISGIGQTKAAIKLCSSIPARDKHYHLQKGVGHYGTFNGSNFRKYIVPTIVDFVAKGAKKK